MPQYSLCLQKLQFPLGNLLNWEFAIVDTQPGLITPIFQFPSLTRPITFYNFPGSILLYWQDSAPTLANCVIKFLICWCLLQQHSYSTSGCKAAGCVCCITGTVHCVTLFLPLLLTIRKLNETYLEVDIRLGLLS